MSVVPISRAGITNGTTDKLNHGKDTVPKASLRVYQQTFNAPGTWTWPGNVSSVEVLVVSGGGAGATQQTTAPIPVVASVSYAGGGGVGVFTVPVSGPVPVTVGAGGTAVTYPATPGTTFSPGGNGGASGFGPITPPIPTNSAWIEGGLGAGPVTVPTYTYQNGGGVASDSVVPSIVTPTGYTQYSQGGRSASSYGSSAAVGPGLGPGTSGAPAGPPEVRGAVRFTYGSGRAAEASYGNYGKGGNILGYPTVVQHLANTGHAGASWSAPLSPAPVAYQGTNGSSGVVIVRWVE